MSVVKRLASIAAGYVLAVVGGFAAVVVNELLMPADIAQGSGGMVAFGDVILFLFVTGVLGLVPTWFLLKLCVEKAPRVLLAAELVIAALGPPSWLALVYLADGFDVPNEPRHVGELVSLVIAFGAIPRVIVGPVLLVIEAATILLMRGRVTRALLAGAMLMDIVPLAMFALHLARMAMR